MDLREAVAEGLDEMDAGVTDWRRDAHGRPILETDFEIRDQDNELLVHFDAVLRVYPVQAPGGKTAGFPTRRQLIALIRQSLVAAVVTETALVPSGELGDGSQPG